MSLPTVNIQIAVLCMHPPVIEKFRDAVENSRSRGMGYKSKLPPSPYRKVIAEASRLRNKGNEAYRKRNFSEALRFYTSSIAHAPTDSEELGLAFGNRSAIHFVQEKYELCLLDVNRALSGKLPESSKQTLLKRKQQCLDPWQEANKMKLKLKKKIKNGENRALYPTERKWLYTHQMSKNETDYKIDYASFDDPIWSTNIGNLSIPGLISPKVASAHNPEYGRHLVAAHNINPGEVISRQEMFALVTSPDEKFRHCSYCTIWCDALIPCFTCTLEMYCSEACRTKAYDLYHRTECEVINKASILFDPEKTKVWLALRMFLTGTKQGSHLKKLMKDPSVYGILSGKREACAVYYPTNDYRAILSLTWNLHRKIPLPAQNDTDSLVEEPETLENLIYLFELLQYINFFNIDITCKNISQITDDEMYAALLLLHHIVVTKRFNFNLHADFTIDPLDFTHADRREIACGTVTLQGFMNHSCNANTINVINRRSAMIFSSRFINKGEQIFTTYDGHNYRHTVRVLRQMPLEYKFNDVCKCRACLEDWPVEEMLVKKKNKYLTKDKVLIQKIETNHESFNRALFANNPPYKYKHGVLERVLRFNKDIRLYVEEPSGTIALCESLIQKFVEKKGNCYVVRKLPNSAE